MDVQGVCGLGKIEASPKRQLNMFRASLWLRVSAPGSRFLTDFVCDPA